MLAGKKMENHQEQSSLIIMHMPYAHGHGILVGPASLVVYRGHSQYQ